MSRPRIGLTVGHFHADPRRPLFKGKTLQFVEKKMAEAIWRAGGLPIPLVEVSDPEYVDAVLDGLEGVVLQGGVDVAPERYGERPLRPEWSGDAVQDAYEVPFIEGVVRRDLPLLGICRGVQILNATLGGTLYQDLATQVDGALHHRDWERYELVEHEVHVTPGTLLARLYGDDPLLVNTIHHQAVRDVAEGFEVSARAPDGVVEAIERVNDRAWLVGIQWHPEWLDGSPQGGPHRCPGAPLFESLVARATAGRA